MHLPLNNWIILFLICFQFHNCKPKTENSDNSIRDLLAISGDTIIGVKWDSGIVITTNGGTTWSAKAKSVFMQQITIDSNGTLWGLDSWIGIHEDSYARLLVSYDFGNNWDKWEYNIQEFFPIKLFSKPYENLAVQTFDNKVFRFGKRGNRNSWISVDTLMKESEGIVYCFPYKIKESTLFKLKSDLSWDSLIKIPEISIPFECLLVNDTLYIAASGNGGYEAFFASVSSDFKIKKFKMQSIQALGVKRDKKGRIWTFGDGGIFLLENDSLKRVY